MPPSQLCAKGGCKDPPVAGTALKLAKEEHTDWDLGKAVWLGQPSQGDYLLSVLPRSLGPKVFLKNDVSTLYKRSVGVYKNALCALRDELTMLTSEE